MAYVREQLIDPAPGGLGTYTFHVNHTDEDAYGTGRNIDVTANTSGNIAVRQQGDTEALIFNLQGTILHEVQYQTMVDFARLTRAQSVLYRDFVGDTYEVLVQSFKVQRKRTLRNPRDGSIPLHYYTYTLQLHAITARSGPFA
jgi:hypothetical protein